MADYMTVFCARCGAEFAGEPSEAIRLRREHIEGHKDADGNWLDPVSRG